MCEFNYNDLVEVFLKFLFYVLFPKTIPHLWKKIICTKKTQTKNNQKIQQKSAEAYRNENTHKEKVVDR